VIVAGQVFPHIGVRFSSWLNPWADATGSGYQMAQSFYALASGGIFGARLRMRISLADSGGRH